MRAEKRINCSLSSFSLDENPPRIVFNAALCEASVLLAMTSATASACARSSLPFKKALWVNSPGLANLAPLSIQASMIR